MTPLAARIAALTAASVGLLAGAPAGAFAATTSGQPQGIGDTLGGTLAGARGLPVSTDPVRTLSGGAIDPATDNVDTVGVLPVGTTPVNNMLEHDGDPRYLNTIPVAGALMPASKLSPST